MSECGKDIDFKKGCGDVIRALKLTREDLKDVIDIVRAATKVFTGEASDSDYNGDIIAGIWRSDLNIRVKILITYELGRFTKMRETEKEDEPRNLINGYNY